MKSIFLIQVGMIVAILAVLHKIVRDIRKAHGFKGKMKAFWSYSGFYAGLLVCALGIYL